MASNEFNNLPKGVVGNDARDTIVRLSKLKLKAPKFGNPESVVRTPNNRGGRSR